MLLSIITIVVAVSNISIANASGVSALALKANIAESTDKLGRIKSAIKTEYKNVKQLPIGKDLAFPYRTISELFEAVSGESDSGSLVQPTELAMYMTVSKSILNSLIESLGARRVLPETTVSFLEKLESLRDEISDFTDRLDKYVVVHKNSNKSAYIDVDSEDEALTFSGRRTTTTTTSTPPPPAPPAMISIYRPKSVPKRTNNPSVPHILV